MEHFHKNSLFYQTHTHTHTFPFPCPSASTSIICIILLIDKQKALKMCLCWGLAGAPALTQGIKDKWSVSVWKHRSMTKWQKYDKMTEGLMSSHQLPFPPLICKLNETKTNEKETTAKKKLELWHKWHCIFNGSGVKLQHKTYLLIKYNFVSSYLLK